MAFAIQCSLKTKQCCRVFFLLPLAAWAVKQIARTGLASQGNK